MNLKEYAHQGCIDLIKKYTKNSNIVKFKITVFYLMF